MAWGRPERCCICDGPITMARNVHGEVIGAVRTTCSNACRQAKYRIEKAERERPAREAAAMRAAGAELLAIALNQEDDGVRSGLLAAVDLAYMAAETRCPRPLPFPA